MVSFTPTLPIHAAPLITAARNALHSASGLCADAWHFTAQTCASLGAIAAEDPHKVCEVSLHGLLGSFLAARAYIAWKRGDSEALMDRGFEAVIYAALAGSGLL